jgi:AraC-like DNA-binding protein
MAPNVIRQMIGASQDTRTMIIHFTMHFLNQAGFTTRAHDFLSYFSSQFKPIWDLDPADSIIIERNMRDLFERCKQADRLFGVSHVFLTLLYEIAAQRQKYSPPLIRQVTRKEELVIRFSNLVSNNFREQHTVQFYADELNVTSKYLTKIVKEINGKTAGQIIDHYIILESKLLLEKPEHTISQVASLLNFSDQSVFGKYFKRITGISPKSFKTRVHY